VCVGGGVLCFFCFFSSPPPPPPPPPLSRTHTRTRTHTHTHAHAHTHTFKHEDMHLSEVDPHERKRTKYGIERRTRSNSGSSCRISPSEIDLRTWEQTIISRSFWFSFSLELAPRESTCVHGNKQLFLFLFCSLSLSNQPLGNGAAYMGTNNYFSLSLVFSFSLELDPRQSTCVPAGNNGLRQLFLSLSLVFFLSFSSSL